MAADIQGYSTSGTTITGSNTWTALSQVIPDDQTRTYNILIIGRSTALAGFEYAKFYVNFSVYAKAGVAAFVDGISQVIPDYISAILIGLTYQVSVTTDTLTVIVDGPTAGDAMQWSADIQWSQF